MAPAPDLFLVRQNDLSQENCSQYYYFFSPVCRWHPFFFFFLLQTRTAPRPHQKKKPKADFSKHAGGFSVPCSPRGKINQKRKGFICGWPCLDPAAKKNLRAWTQGAPYKPSPSRTRAQTFKPSIKPANYIYEHSYIYIYIYREREPHIDTRPLHELTFSIKKIQALYTNQLHRASPPFSPPRLSLGEAQRLWRPPDLLLMAEFWTCGAAQPLLDLEVQLATRTSDEDARRFPRQWAIREPSHLTLASFRSRTWLSFWVWTILVAESLDCFLAIHPKSESQC